MKKKIILTCVFLMFCESLFFGKGKNDSVNQDSLENSNVQLIEEMLTSEKKTEEKPVQLYELNKVKGKAVSFEETWGYVSQGREKDYNKSLPVSDVCYFSAEINCYGEFVGAPVRSRLDVGKARCHMVVMCDSRSLTHFIISSEYGIRDRLIEDIVKAADLFDGVQIDFEYVPARDSEIFLSFLSDLRNALSGKYFSVCVPARYKKSKDDIYPYAEIADRCDRVFIMAYDEHWSTSEPGAIASLDWCKKVAEFAEQEIPESKIVMGIPFYGRIWAEQTTSGAYIFSSLNKKMIENGVTEVVYENEIPTFKYQTTVDVTGYFNDAYSDIALLRMYQDLGIQKIGFWRIGQEDPEFWKWLKVKSKK